jgi:hypothetical protein
VRTLLRMLAIPARCMVCYQDPCIGGANCPK